MAIAIVGMACRYPDSRTPGELWENVLAQRRAFRRIPKERLRLEDYWSPERGTPDRTYSTEAALVTDWEFDRVAFKVAGSTYRSADLAHWLALDVASQALEDAGFARGEGLPRESTGVLLGNTLTGEFSRANVMRLRWPYVRRVVDAELAERGVPAAERRATLEALEARYKAPFPPVGEETLAGGLSNTIAGRVCNHFDLKGGGFTVDGACASSLLAVAQACSALEARDLDVALAGGVDLSLDPFELVGFAHTAALAPSEMRVYDRRSAGFWPGEGCGVLVLTRLEDAVAAGRRVYAVVRGWGISSDGSGGITRPEPAGQLLAIQRAYRRAGFRLDSVSYIEGHGTGTSVGDETEIRVLSRARREAGEAAPAAALGSIKAIFGHTKAAAGAAGLIKATLALHHQVLPPTAGCEDPHPAIAAEGGAVRVLREAEPWPEARPLRAAVSSMGFGGINAHIALEAEAAPRRRSFEPHERALAAAAQDAELFLFSAAGAAELAAEVEHVLAIAAGLSRAELSDLAAAMSRALVHGAARAAVVAAAPAELAARLGDLHASLVAEDAERLDPRDGVFHSRRVGAPRIGWLFPGQGSPAHLGGGLLRRRFETVRDLYERARLPQSADGVATEVAQPAIVTASLAALRVFERLGIEAEVAVGHSLGELTALRWAGACDDDALIAIAAARGRAMADLGSPTGAMASIRAGREEVETLLSGSSAVIAGLNAPRQTVVSGESQAVAAVVERARARGLTAVPLPVSHAFHSSLVAAAAPALAARLETHAFRPLERAVCSTVTGGRLDPREDLRSLLVRQVTSPVRFAEALGAAARDVDLWIEAGPGRVLSGLASECSDVPAIATDAGGPSIAGVLAAAAAAFALGCPLRHDALFADRFTRAFEIGRRPKFFVNPCELAPVSDDASAERALSPVAEAAPDGVEVAPRSGVPAAADARTAIEVVRELVAARAELPAESVHDENRLLSDLHLNSIAVGQLVAEAARRLGQRPPVDPTAFANASVIEVARALEELGATAGEARPPARESVPAGLDAWVRPFVMGETERPRPKRAPPVGAGGWRLFAAADHPLAAGLGATLAGAEGSGVVVCLPARPDERSVPLLLDAARAALEGRSPRAFVLVQSGPGAASFARSLHLESPWIATHVVDVPADARAIQWVMDEALSGRDHSECRYDAEGRRFEPVLRLLEDDGAAAPLPLSSGDVLLVTGGGKGIAAECALSLARESGAKLALVGRSQPGADPELSRNLDRIAAAGVTVRYHAADVTDPPAVREAVRALEADLGPVTALIHGAGANAPRLIESLDERAFLTTLAPKVAGARNVLEALDPARLKLFVAFGSIIARTGMKGEADYAVANEWLARIAEEWRAEHPHCRCLAIEFSVWSGVGMGERLGRMEALAREGVAAIPPEQGAAMLRRLIARTLPVVPVVVTGRFGDPPTLRMERAELPLLRFLERPILHVPGVELIAEAELAAESDPYLDDHVFRGERLLPAVIGLEAMAQAAAGLAGVSAAPVFEDVRFERPVVVPARRAVTLRLVALAREPGVVDVALRSSESGFAADHFRATCRFGAPAGAPANGAAEGAAGERTAAATASTRPDHERAVTLDPARDLYGGLLFHGGRFRRLSGYRELTATACVAEIAADGAVAWFGRYLPGGLVLGDPAARDAAIHAVQACIPHATVLPVAVRRIVAAPLSATERTFVRAREREQDGDEFVYDLELLSPEGVTLERWEGLRLRRIAAPEASGPWPASLLGPYVERRVKELVPGARVTVAIEAAAAEERSVRGRQALERLSGGPVAVAHRPDGKPEADGFGAVSLSHAGHLTMAVAGEGTVGCDLEPVAERGGEVWRDLLGAERLALAELIARETGESEGAAATRVWAAGEALKKAGAAPQSPLLLVSASPDGWVVLSSARLTVATLVSGARGMEAPLALAVLVASPAA
jgi:enediyne polyketide synthase